MKCSPHFVLTEHTLVLYMEGWIAIATMLSNHSGPPHTIYSRLMYYAYCRPVYNKATCPVLSHREGYIEISYCNQAMSLMHLCSRFGAEGGHYRQVSLCSINVQMPEHCFRRGL